MNENVEKQPARGLHGKLPRPFLQFVLWFVGVAVLVLGLVWLLFDDALNAGITRWIGRPELNPFVYSLAIIGLLAADLLLPIPSSALITHAGMKLGVLQGTILGFLGVTIGSLIGFVMARRLGKTFVMKRTDENDRIVLGRLTGQYGVFIVVFLRPVPILAEASVLLLAAGQMAWRPFLVWLSVSNFFVALFFAAFGQWAAERGIGELPALLISIAVPVLLLICVRLILKEN